MTHLQNWPQVLLPRLCFSSLGSAQPPAVSRILQVSAVLQCDHAEVFPVMTSLLATSASPPSSDAAKEGHIFDND